MIETPYQVFGTTPAPLIGRKRIFEEIMRNFNREKPQHLSVIGAPFIGKTVLLQELAHYLNTSCTIFDACIYWDVHRSRIDNDSAFYAALSLHSAQVLSKLDAELAKDLYENSTGDYGVLRDVFELFNAEGRKILLVLDQLDLLLISGGVTRNLWDNLRSLAQKPGLRLITSSSKPLSELCCSPESRTSDFWNIFRPESIKLEVLSNEDWTAFLAPFEQRRIAFEKGVETEIQNWTGGIPVLVAALCNTLWERIENESVISLNQINQIAEKYFTEDVTILPSLWNKCDTDEQSDLHDLANGEVLKIDQTISKAQAQSLMQKGYVKEQKGNLKMSCRAMGIFAKTYGADATGLKRLFGSADEYQKNLRGLLELRLNQIPIGDADLHAQIANAIQLLDTSPPTAIRQIRGIVDDLFQMIWKIEIPTGKIPVVWVQRWRASGGNDNCPSGNVPEGGKRCQLLNLMTESRTAVGAKVSRSTYYLINSLHSYGDFGQHLQGEKVSLVSVAIALLTALELYAQLSRELSLNPQQI